jgi:hypothetical protein
MSVSKGFLSKLSNIVGFFLRRPVSNTDRCTEKALANHQDASFRIVALPGPDPTKHNLHIFVRFSYKYVFHEYL